MQERLLNVPITLFSFEASFCIIQDSSRHLLEVWVHVLMTCTAAQSMERPVEWACSASTEVVESPMWMAWWCSFRRHARVLLVCPMYACGQLLHSTRFTYDTLTSILNRNKVLSAAAVLLCASLCMVTELLFYLFSLFKVLLCSEHPIAVATLCASPGRLCCLART